MKNFKLSLATIMAMSTFAVAGGDIAPVVEPVVEVAPVADDSGFYIGGALSHANASTDVAYGSGDDYIDGYSYDYTWSFDNDVNAYMIQAGYQFNKYIAVEGRYWGSAKDDTSWTSAYNGSQYDSGSYSDGDFSAWGIYVKPMYPVTESFSVYGLLGYGNTSIDDDFWYDKPLLDTDGFQWGIGASYSLTENLSVFFDYVQLSDGEGESYSFTDGNYYSYDQWETDVYTLNLGLTYKF
jgi:opacity protein-like surface antigen